ncbi:protein kinase domain-containing protein [Gordonia sp. DT219]|uniref:protein kinase domain-containing protein n=1 Tax=Gordonia sp. DT219 TaxID=3416658 RepID=UPI003CF3769E
MASARQSLRAGQLITGDTGHRYRIDSLLDGGGFGVVYRASRLAATSDRVLRKVCVKVCASAADWHGEAHMGHLLAGRREVVQVLDAFAFGGGSRSATRYVIVSELMREGTVGDLILDGTWHGWRPTRVRREIRGLLAVLKLMHAAGVTHRDIKPDNVFLRDGHLTLGDFGIAKHSLTPWHSPSDPYTPAYMPVDVDDYRHWATWLDIYQLGLLACTLLTGRDWTNDAVPRIRDVEAPEDLKCWIWHAIAGKGMRYVDGNQALDALVGLHKIDMCPARGPSTLAGHRVVITGRFSTGTQPELAQLIEDAGAVVQSTVGDDTTILVRAHDIEGAVGVHEGRKLFGARERKRRGQPIHVIDEDRLCRLMGLAVV